MKAKLTNKNMIPPQVYHRFAGKGDLKIQVTRRKTSRLSVQHSYLTASKETSAERAEHQRADHDDGWSQVRVEENADGEAEQRQLVEHQLQEQLVSNNPQQSALLAERRDANERLLFPQKQ